MLPNTTHYKSVRLNADYVESMAKEALANGCQPINPERYGYVLVATRLVPLTFIERIKTELADSYFDYDGVLSESALFDDAFLQSLNDDERAVLMPSVLVLIERGEVGFNLFATSETQVAAA